MIKMKKIFVVTVQLLMLRIPLKQIPVKALCLIPLCRLSKILPHKQQLLTRMHHHQTIGCPEITELIRHVSRHLVNHGLLQNALANAEKAVEAKESQKSIDAAEKNLQAAIDGLKKASATINTNSTTNNNKKNNTTTTTKKNNTTTSKKSPKTGDPVSVLGLLGAAVSSLGIGGLGLKLRRKSRREDEE